MANGLKQNWFERTRMALTCAALTFIGAIVVGVV